MLADWYLLDTATLAALLAKDPAAVRYRLRQLLKAGYLQRVEQKFDYSFWLLDLAGIHKAKHLFPNPDEPGFLCDKIERRPEWSLKNKEHDLEVLQLRLALHRRHRGNLVFWKLWPSEINDRFESGAKAYYVEPDAFFGVNFRGAFTHAFLEHQRANARKDSLDKKAEAYQAYFESGEFEKTWGLRHPKVIFTFRSEETVENLCKKWSRAHAGSVFWITTYWQFLTNPTGAIFRAPVDGKDERHSFPGQV